MAKQRKLLCYGPYCHSKWIKHDRHKMIKNANKHYCQRCWKLLKAQRLNRHYLYHYIKDKTKIGHLNGIELRDISNLHRKYHYTYKGIRTALQYADRFSTKFSFRNPFFIRYVPFIYDQAQDWRYKQDRHDNMELNETHINNQIEHATVHADVFKPKKKLPQYDMNQF